MGLPAVDARDVAVAFASATDRGELINARPCSSGGGNESFLHLQRDIEDDMMEAAGLGRLGSSASLPGDPTTKGMELHRLVRHHGVRGATRLPAARLV